MSLPPVPQQIAVFPHFVAAQCETLVIQEKVLSLTGDSFDIKLASGQPIFRVKGQVFSLGGRKSVFDMNGNHLFDIRKELLHLHTTFALYDPQGNTFFELKNRIKLFGSKATATFTSRAGKSESLTMEGNWLDTSANIVDDSNGATVAVIDRKLLNARELIFGQQCYAVVVAPGVDMAVLAAMCICLDEKNNEGN